MNKNFYSLLSSNWMFAGDSKAILLPYLFNIIKGNSLASKETLANTTASFISKTGMQTGNTIDCLPSQDSVAVLNVHHPIFKYDQECGPRGTQSIINLLEIWKDDDKIKGVVIDYNSGGGQVSGTAEIANYIHNYSKPIVGFSKDTVGSAAYYMYAASKYTVFHPHADVIGSIGTMFYKVDVQKVLENAGATVHEIYSDLSPKKNNASRELREGNDRPLIDKVLNPMATEFHSDITKFRPNIHSEALEGDVFFKDDALRLGLIDEIGNLQTAINKVFELSQSNSKPNNNMSKQRANVQAVLGLENPLASTDNGSYLNDEQLDAVEAHLTDQATAMADLQTQLDDANNNTDLNNQLTEATNSITTVETSVDAMLEEAGLEVSGTLTEKLTALSGKVETMAAKDGAASSRTIIDTTKGSDTKVVQLDANASHNQLADQIHQKK